MGHARALITLENTSLQLRIFKQILAKGLSVREVESLVRSTDTQPAPLNRQTKEELTPNLVDMQERLNSRLNAQVKLLVNRKGAGTITISFHSEEELKKIFTRLEL